MQENSKIFLFTNIKFPNFSVMPSAQIQVLTKDKSFIPARVLLDSCSTVTFVTYKFAKTLNIPLQKTNISIDAMNDLNTTCQHCIEITIKSNYSNYKKSIICFVIPKIIDNTPADIISRANLSIRKTSNWQTLFSINQLR